MTTREKTIETNIVKYLNSLDGCYAEKTHGGMYGNAGKPDVDACLNGRALKIEVKNETGRVSKLQEKMMERWKAAGAVVFVARSVDDVRMELLGRGLLYEFD